MLTKTLLNGLYYTKLDSVLAPFTQGIGSIWMLHRVNNTLPGAFSPNSHLAISPEFLDMAILQCKLMGYTFVSMDEMSEHLQSGGELNQSGKLISVTLDDAYLDNLEEAVPVFDRHRVPYTIFVSPGFVDATHTLWWEDLEHIIAGNKKITLRIHNTSQTLNTASSREKHKAYSELVTYLCNETDEDEQREIVNRLSRDCNYDPRSHVKSQIMNWEQLKVLSKEELCTLGAHTVGHYALSRLDEERARNDLQCGHQECKVLLLKAL